MGENGNIAFVDRKFLGEFGDPNHHAIGAFDALRSNFVSALARSLDFVFKGLAQVSKWSILEFAKEPLDRKSVV